MGLRTGDALSFFAATPEGEEILSERRQALDESPAHYAAVAEAGRPFLDETRAFAESSGIVTTSANPSIESLGRVLEPDFVFLQGTEGGPVIVGGVVCFPSSWALPEKMGLTLDQTHGPVPGLNAQLAQRVRTALDRLVPGSAWERDNWGMARDGNRNHHPSRPRQRLDATVEPDEIWLRVERQILYRLPKTGGLLFGIRVETCPWHEFAVQDEVISGLRWGLETMSAEVAAYKGLAAARTRILELLPG
jgi:hypothetical protein